MGALQVTTATEEAQVKGPFSSRRTWARAGAVTEPTERGLAILSQEAAAFPRKGRFQDLTVTLYPEGCFQTETCTLLLHSANSMQTVRFCSPVLPAVCPTRAGSQE